MSADSVEQNAAFKAKYNLPWPMLADPDLTTRESLGVKSQRVHPMALTYPKKAFLQPSVFFFDSAGEILFSWIQTPKLTNFYGAKDRMEPDDIVTKAEELLAG